MINELDFKVPIDLCTGKSKLPLSDLKQLEEDDIVLLEKAPLISCGGSEMTTTIYI